MNDCLLNIEVLFLGGNSSFEKGGCDELFPFKDNKRDYMTNKIVEVI